MFWWQHGRMDLVNKIDNGKTVRINCRKCTLDVSLSTTDEEEKLDEACCRPFQVLIASDAFLWKRVLNQTKKHGDRKHHETLLLIIFPGYQAIHILARALSSLVNWLANQRAYFRRNTDEIPGYQTSRFHLFS